jgi:hypothetical protein
VFGPAGLGYIPDSPQQLGGWTGGNATMINDAINSGAFMLQHRDHGAETGWGEPAYSNSNINGLTNTDLTHIFSINCLTGKYNWSSECFTEKFHRYRYNNVNSGALSVTGASEVSYSFVNDTYVWGLIDNMWPDFMPQYGSNPEERGLLPAFGNAAGKYFLQQSSWPYNTGNKVVTYHLFHHHGDAFQTLYSEVPQDLTIMHDGVILAGLTTFTITADEGSTICLSEGDNIIGLEEGTGSPVVMSIIPQSVGTQVILTVTKTNFYRYEETLEVIPAEGPYCIFDTYAIQDTTGNGNGLVDYNENVFLNLAIKNVGMENGENVTVTISTVDPYITLSDNTELYGTIPSQGSVTIENGFSFYAAENTPDQHQVIMNVQSTDGTNIWNSLFMFKVNSPVLNINTLTINDQTNGNGDGELDPGESVTMTINYTNTGHAVAYDVDVYLEGQSGFIEVLNPSQHFNSIGFLGVFNKSFDVTVDTNAPEGIMVNFMNELTMGSFWCDKNYPEKISAMIEDFETGDFEKYGWEFAGNTPWQTTMQFPYAGYYSAKSGAISGGQSSELELTYEVMSADSISFVRKVSSEPNDKLKFYIGNDLMEEWSGTTGGWVREAFAVTPGVKTFRWVYAKDNSTNGGTDMAWLDNIVLPTPLCLTIWAGPDQADCPGEIFEISESYGTNYTVIDWTTSGTGTFDDNSIMHPAYTPSGEDISNGSVTLTLTLQDEEGNIVADEAVINFLPTPEAAPTPEGPDYVDLFLVTSSEYTTAGIEGLDEYVWQLDPAEAGTIEGTTVKATVYWNPGYIGMAYVNVAAINECGAGTFSESFEVTVDNTVGLPDNGSLASALSIFPNPGNGNYQLTLNNISGNVHLKLFNVMGSLIYEYNVHVSGSYQKTLNLENLADGVYFLKIEGDGISMNRKLVKN